MTSTFRNIIQLHRETTASVFQIAVDDSRIFNLQRNEFTINQKKTELTDYFESEFKAAKVKIRSFKNYENYSLKFMKITFKEDLTGFIIEFSAKTINLSELSDLISLFFKFPFAIAKKTGDNPKYIKKNLNFVPIERDSTSPVSDGRSSSCSLIYEFDGTGQSLLLPLKETEKETEKKS
tara:strand:+ start:1484 stop:2020 length:537 start_codon:yes stop_codon:yes gene_type:complete